MTALSKYVIIVSGGAGSRMKSELPKQFLELRGLPVLMHTISAFYKSTDAITIVLVLNEGHKPIWENLCKKYSFEIPHVLIYGGRSRFHSVKNGLNYILGEETPLERTLIAIHDGVRPFISQNLIRKAYALAEKEGTAVPAIKSKDSIRIINQNGETKSISRDSVLLIQTPQTFQAELLKKAYQQEFNDSFTDDASVIEKSGYPIHIIEGDIRNIKITYPIDLIIAEILMNKSV